MSETGERRESGSLPLGARRGVVLRIPAGSLRVEAVEGSAEVSYEVAIRAEGEDVAALASGLDRVVVRAEPGRGEAMEISVERGGISRKVEIDIDLFVRVPLDCDLTLVAAAGRIAVDRVRGRLRVENHSGSVDLGEVDGEVDATLFSGKLRIGRVTGPARVDAKSGEVEIGEAGDGVDIRQGAGKVAVKLTGSPRRASRVDAMAGEVRLSLAEGVGVDLDAEARSGRVRVERTFPAQGSLRSYRGPLQGGGMPFVVRSFAGSIAVDAASAHG